MEKPVANDDSIWISGEKNDWNWKLLNQASLQAKTQRPHFHQNSSGIIWLARHRFVNSKIRETETHIQQPEASV